MLAAIASLQRAAAFYDASPFYAYDPLASLVGFHESAHPRRLLRKPNQIGGSFACAWESWAHLIGRHRWRPNVRAASGMVLVASLEDAYPQVCEKLWLTAPREALDPATKYIEGKGFFTNSRRLVRTRDGKRIEFRGCEGDAMGVESASVGWLWGDEPPKPPHFSAAISRVAVAMGPVWWNFTPINRPVAWFKKHVEGDPKTGEKPREEWVQFRPKLSQEDCTTLGGRVIRSAESIRVQIAGYTRSQILQRVYGEWEGLNDDRALSAFNEDVHTVPPTFDDDADVMIGVGIDHGEQVGNQVGVLGRYQILPGNRRRVHITGECVSTAKTTEVEDATALLEMLGRDGLELRHVDRMVGDINSAGKAANGRSINAMLTEEINRQAGYPHVVVEVERAKKGRIIDRIRTFNLAFMRGWLTIDPRCINLLEAVRMWDNTPQTEQFKHWIDALAYLAVPLLEHDETGNAPSRVALVG